MGRLIYKIQYNGHWHLSHGNFYLSSRYLQLPVLFQFLVDFVLQSIRQFLPSLEKNLIPLSKYGLCDAEMTMPKLACKARVKWAMAGVGKGPSRCT